MLILRICGVEYLLVGVESLRFHNVFLTFSGSSLALGVDLKSAGSTMSAGVEILRFIMCF